MPLWEFLTPQSIPLSISTDGRKFRRALFFEEQGFPAADASFNVTNFESGLFLLEVSAPDDALPFNNLPVRPCFGWGNGSPHSWLGAGEGSV